MKGISSKWKWLLLFSCITICFGIFPETRTNAFSSQVIQKGAVGDDVIELQARLQNIGYYHGKIDGVYGWGTYWALRNFQQDFGLPIDGFAGTSTKQKLANASNFNRKFVHEQINKGNEFTYYGGVDIEKQVKVKGNVSGSKPSGGKAPSGKTPSKTATAANLPGGYSQNDIQLMANAVYGEARGEPYTGQVAVAAVILNRVESVSFPNTISGVIFEPGAFTAVADGQIWLTPNERAKEAVVDAINGWDPSGNAEYYFNPDTATSKWIWSREQIKRIGKHIFCK
ncbi:MULTISPECIES: spore cortex-lytic enzyme [Peribacillus]|jgi:N-acetylmuramoyl-L-alanine amidase|uniref:spore cortex-lytic enzyme n=1 Tax=Peribacillus TaxID=2675229 RepID=UPI0019144908|nr:MULTISPECIES: spore cortex-lytic enzyme [unclassified Peribacillus]MBK5442381.1 spore cortex-lytic enzyme [Peribacillus sp. TH24]MBK5462869.1 spore cortex-lytic enzyme [Peribacillus sp. TH27]MBK5483790.1 spore cortex-lytic enzyme [Peribacillus sp. TH16]MBK5501052.1 spore cortex-lytic enzyme [Peribacillus sp. TH14]WMX53978.1 spore cortex-lytic enzyme [Peribacillus sp. R9-11]